MSTYSEKLRKLIADCDHLTKEMEYRTVSLSGVHNLSRSDIDELKMRAENALSANPVNLMRPLGGVAEVMAKYGINIKKGRIK